MSTPLLDKVLEASGWPGQKVINIYGYWDKNFEPDVKFSFEFWPKDTKCWEGKNMSTNSNPDIGQHNREEDEPPWTQIRWEIKPVLWPIPNWEETLKQTFQVLIDAGALVAWCDLEGHPPYPPAIFRDYYSKTHIYAYLTKNGDFNCTAFAGQPFKAVPEKEIAMLADLLYKGKPEWDLFVRNHNMDMSKW